MNTVRHLVIATAVTVVVVVLLLVVYLGENGRMEKEVLAQQGNAIARGARLYDSYCSGCHGKRGEGIPGVYPPLNVEDLWAGRQDIAFYGTLHDYISLNIAAGHPAQRMPSWADEYGGPLRVDQIEDLTQFVLNWMGQQPEGVRGEVAAPARTITPAGPQPAEPVAAGDPVKGAEIFAANCATCHGENAQGGTLGPTLVSAQSVAQNDDFYRQIIANGRMGSAMPAWSNILSAQSIEDVIAFIRSKQ